MTISTVILKPQKRLNTEMRDTDHIPVENSFHKS